MTSIAAHYKSMRFQIQGLPRIVFSQKWWKNSLKCNVMKKWPHCPWLYMKAKVGIFTHQCINTIFIRISRYKSQEILTFEAFLKRITTQFCVWKNLHGLLVISWQHTPKLPSIWVQVIPWFDLFWAAHPANALHFSGYSHWKYWKISSWVIC